MQGDINSLYSDIDSIERTLPQFAATPTSSPVYTVSVPNQSCTWRYYSGYYLNGDAESPNTYSTRDAAIQRCVKLDTRCNAIKFYGGQYRVLFKPYENPKPSSSGKRSNLDMINITLLIVLNYIRFIFGTN